MRPVALCAAATSTSPAVHPLPLSKVCAEPGCGALSHSNACTAGWCLEHLLRCNCAAVGKSSLICHLAEEEVSEVLHGRAGSVRAVDSSINCNGLGWNVVDVPGCNGLHMGKGWIGREVTLSSLTSCLLEEGHDFAGLAAAESGTSKVPATSTQAWGRVIHVKRWRSLLTNSID